MALLGSTFVTDDVKDIADPGEYTLQIIKSEMKPTKAATGEYLLLTMEILDDGPFKGMTIRELLNLVNPNEKAVQIARSTLAKICKALEIKSFEDTAELHGVPFKGIVKIQEGNDGYADQNKVQKYMKLSDESEDAGW